MTLGFLAGALAAAAPLALHFLRHPADFLGRTSALSVFSDPAPLAALGRNLLLTAGMLNVRGDADWVHNVSGRPQLFWPVGIAFLVGLALALRRRSLLDRVLLLWVALAAVPVVLSNSALPHALRALPMVPAVLGLAGAGFVAAGRFIRARSAAFPLGAAAAALAVALGAEAAVSTFGTWGRSERTGWAMGADYAAVARAINALPRETEKVVVVRVSGDDVRGLPWPTQSVQFLTDSFLPDARAARHIRYVSPLAFEALRPRLAAGARVFVLD